MIPKLETRKEQKTVKAFENDIALINEHAKLWGCTAAEVIHRMCEELRKQVYLQELGESFESVVANTEQFAALQAENQAWDCTLADGLDNAT
ncbi:MAG: hypothetical protein IT342_27570 [Candidatus Melainabacteria bacterium]|jgi:hypothetical protein|nr:hypothetical protein [Candidatus Melainabacteria bacterium]